MRRQVYSSRRLSAKDFGRFVSGVGPGPVTIGVDVSKRELVLMVRRGPGNFLGPLCAANPLQVREVVDLVGLVAARGPVKVAMEPSGTYGDALRQAMSDAKLELHKVGSKRSHDYAEVFDGVPSQHDGKDAAVIAELCAIGKSSPWAYEPPDEKQGRMRLLVEWMDGQDRIRRLWLGRLEAILARHWPEATGVLPLRSATLLRALEHYRGPADLAADPQAVHKLLGWGGKLLRREKAEALVESARTTPGVRQNQADRDRLGRVAGQALAACHELRRSRSQLKQLAEGNPTIAAQAAAVGLATACVLWVRLGDPHDYPAAAAYLKAMGLNLAERSSGQHKGHMHISKRGDPLVRRWLHMAALRLVGAQGPVRDYYRGKRAGHGGSHRYAITAVVRRLAVALYKVAVHDRQFDPARLFAGPKAAQAASGGK